MIKIAHRIINDNFNGINDIQTAIKKLITGNFAGVEFDLRETKDGKFIIHHDRWIFSQNIIIKQNDFNCLKLFSTKANKYLMTLEELLELLPKQLILNMEIKDSKINVNELLKILNKFAIADNTIVSSFHPKIIELFSKTEISKCWLLTSISYKNNFWQTIYALNPIKYARKCFATGIAPNYKLISKKILDKAHNQGLTVAAWTVNEQQIIEKLDNCGIDYVISDLP